MNKKMLILWIIFVLLMSCKYDASDKDLKSIKRDLEKQVKGLLSVKNLDNLDDLDRLDSGFKPHDSEFGKLVKDAMQLQKQVEDKLAQGVFSDLELQEKVGKKVQELKIGIEKRKNQLENAKKKFEDFKSQIDSTFGSTYAHGVQNRRGIGLEAWRHASSLGLGVKYPTNISANTDALVKNL
ncbi:hypothetical protein QIA00_05390 (plasmid) [Borreliella americana]|uniref:Uncharacterized protein n=1 Tax=Borreliella americana TaxID=478807 RepID=A0ACD5G5Y8_9SPIR